MRALKRFSMARRTDGRDGRLVTGGDSREPSRERTALLKRAPLLILLATLAGCAEQAPTGASARPPQPSHLLSTASGGLAYVTNVFSGNVSVIDIATNTVTATVGVGGEPRGVAITPDGRRAYVANGSGSVSVIDIATNTVTAFLGIGRVPADVAITPDGTRAYVTNADSRSVSVIDIATNTVTATIEVGFVPVGVAITPDGTRAYVANQNSFNVLVIDIATNTVTAVVGVGANPVDVAITPDGTRAYVANLNSVNVLVIDIPTNTVTATVGVGNNPFAVAITSDGTRAYVANSGSASVSVIDIATNTVIATVGVGELPNGVAITPDGRRAYVTNRFSDNVSVIDIATNTVTATVPAGLGPFGVAITPTLTTPEDREPPVLTVPADMTVEATSPAGAVVTYTASATDNVDPAPNVSCDPTSGAAFALGSTTVTCTATDAAGNEATASFVVTVVDTTLPVLSLPADFAVDATSPSGAVVSYTVSASDAASIPTTSCTPASGSLFAIGAHTVNCTATDASGNSTAGSFAVTVKGAAEQVTDLQGAVSGLGLPKGTETSLVQQLAAASSALALGDRAGACASLQGLISHVNAQSGKKISAADAALLIEAAEQIQAVLGC